MNRMVAGGLAVVVGAVILTLSTVTPALAYAYTGCKWNSSTVQISTYGVVDPYHTPLNQAISDFSTMTDLTVTAYSATGPTFKAVNPAFYGYTGWEAENQAFCPFGIMSSSEMRLNKTYLPTSTPQARLKVVWAHEIGHGFGLDDLSSPTNRLMYASASDAYFAGVRTLTSDEVAGINNLY